MPRDDSDNTDAPSPPLIGPLGWLGGVKNDLMHRPAGNLPVLDVLRSLAILLVFTRHAGGGGGGFAVSARIGRLPPVHSGWTGVDLFFVLSGVLIGQQLWKELKSTGHIKIGRFLLRRGLRIWPLYFSLMLLLAGEVLLLGRTSKGLLADALFVSNYFPGQVGGGWSLSTEEQFYVLAPVAISLLIWKFKPKTLWVLPLAMLCGSVFARAVQAATSVQSVDDLRNTMYPTFHTHADSLAMGLLLAWLSVFNANLFRSKRMLKITMAAMVGLGIVLYLFRPILFSYTTLSLLFGAATLYGMGPFVIPRLLKWHGFYVVSRLSYGMYLNHFGVLLAMRSFLGPWCVRHGEPAFVACYVLCLVATICLAALTFAFIEWPCLVLRSRYLKERGTAVAFTAMRA